MPGTSLQPLPQPLLTNNAKRQPHSLLIPPCLPLPGLPATAFSSISRRRRSARSAARTSPSGERLASNGTDSHPVHSSTQQLGPARHPQEPVGECGPWTPDWRCQGGGALHCPRLEQLWFAHASLPANSIPASPSPFPPPHPPSSSPHPTHPPPTHTQSRHRCWRLYPRCAAAASSLSCVAPRLPPLPSPPSLCGLPCPFPTRTRRMRTETTRIRTRLSRPSPRTKRPLSDRAAAAPHRAVLLLLLLQLHQPPRPPLQRGPAKAAARPPKRLPALLLPARPLRPLQLPTPPPRLPRAPRPAPPAPRAQPALAPQHANAPPLPPLPPTTREQAEACGWSFSFWLFLCPIISCPNYPSFPHTTIDAAEMQRTTRALTSLSSRLLCASRCWRRARPVRCSSSAPHQCRRAKRAHQHRRSARHLPPPRPPPAAPASGGPARQQPRPKMSPHSTTSSRATTQTRKTKRTGARSTTITRRSLATVSSKQPRTRRTR